MTERTDKFIETLKSIRKNPEICGKHGLLSNSGLVPWIMPDGTVRGIFVSMSYDADGKVFVRSDGDPDEEEFISWTRMDPEEAAKHPKDIIRCSFKSCTKPAVRLDHHHPYDDMMTNCEEHMNWFNKEHE
jgi:hypothetical protein